MVHSGWRTHLTASSLRLEVRHRATVSLQVVPSPSPSPEPCCHPVAKCQRRPKTIIWALRQIESYAQSGLSPIEALIAGASTTHDDTYRPEFGPREPNLALLAADISRAIKAGCRTPWEMSRFLCPIGYEMACALADPDEECDD